MKIFIAFEMIPRDTSPYRRINWFAFSFYLRHTL